MEVPPALPALQWISQDLGLFQDLPAAAREAAGESLAFI